MLLIIGALWFPLAGVESMRLTHAAQQAANVGAASSGNPCQDAMDAAAAILARPVGAGSSCAVEPGPPALIRVRLTGGLPVPPVLAFATDGRLVGEAASAVAP